MEILVFPSQVMNPSEDQPQGRNIAGVRIREARMAFKPRLTQDQLAGKLAAEGVQLDRVAITKIETGTRSVLDFELRGLARALKVDAGWLLGMNEYSGNASIAPTKRKDHR